MREIKFRAWDGEVMHQDWLVLTKESSGEVSTCRLSKRGVEVMQFTGLHDKNDKEIYEGDVAAWIERGMKNCKVIGQVSWYKDGWTAEGFYDGSQDEPGRAFSENAELEILGNIYENPELLN
jgi:uncharacterized phage protein (TIGR01671 family)